MNMPDVIVIALLSPLRLGPIARTHLQHPRAQQPIGHHPHRLLRVTYHMLHAKRNGW